MAALQREVETYEQHLPAMLSSHSGQFVVIRGEQLLHYADSYEQALDWSYERLGVDGGFLVKRVSPDHDVAHFTRDMGPCRT